MPTKWEPASGSRSAIMTHRALQLAATSGPVPRPLALEEEFGGLHIGVESGADYQGPLLEHGVQVSGSNPEFGEALKSLAWLAGCCCRWRWWWNVAGSLWVAPPGTRETLPFWAGCLETGAGLKDGDLGRRGQCDPILFSWEGKRAEGFQPFHFNAPAPVPAPAIVCG